MECWCHTTLHVTGLNTSECKHIASIVTGETLIFICPDPGYGTKGWKFAYVLVVVVVLFSGYDASCILNIFCIFLSSYSDVYV